MTTSKSCLKRLIYYDLETTGLDFHNKHKDIEIVEIGAVDGVTRETFQQYIYPAGNHIPQDASNVHGISIENGKLVRNSKPLDAVDPKTGLSNFLAWLKSFREPVTLSGYNSHNYDDWVICHNLHREGLCLSRQGSVAGFLDVSKIARPYLKSHFGTRKWSLTFAVESCLERGQCDAHTAVSDSFDTLDLNVKLWVEEMPEKALREVGYNETMCKRIAKGLAIDEYKTGSKHKQFNVLPIKVDENIPKIMEVNTTNENMKSRANASDKTRKRRNTCMATTDDVDDRPQGKIYNTRSKKRFMENSKRDG